MHQKHEANLNQQQCFLLLHVKFAQMQLYYAPLHGYKRRKQLYMSLLHDSNYRLQQLHFLLHDYNYHSLYYYYQKQNFLRQLQKYLVFLYLKQYLKLILQRVLHYHSNQEYVHLNDYHHKYHYQQFLYNYLLNLQHWLRNLIYCMNQKHANKHDQQQ